MGRRRFGRYEILEEIGKGSMGVVYKAYDPLLKRRLAIKSMGASAHDDEEFVQRFFREAEATAGLNHPNIVAIYDIGEVESQPYIAMEYLEGENLGTILRKGAFFPFERKLDVAIQLCEGLEHAHSRGVIHRDVKPSNVQITPQGQIKIVDFGIAKVLSSNLTTVGQLMGTPSYMAPEQIAGGRVDGRSDVFGVGVMFYQLLTGRKPFEGEDFRAVMFSIAGQPHPPVNGLLPGCPSALASIVDRALAKNPSERFETARQMQEALESFCQDLPGLELELQKEVGVLRERVQQRRMAFVADVELAKFAADIGAAPSADPDQTVFGPPVKKERDYGYLLARHAQLSTDLARLDQLTRQQKGLQTLAAESRRLFEREDWQSCLDRLEKILEAIPESVEAARLKQRCGEKIEQARLGRETALEIEEALQEVKALLADNQIVEANRLAAQIRERDPENPRLPELEERLGTTGQRAELHQSLSEQDLNRAQELFQKRRWKEAAEAIESALRRDPENDRALELQGRLQSRSARGRKLSIWGLVAAGLLLGLAVAAWLNSSRSPGPIVVLQVQAGDTLEELAARVGVPVPTLAANNRLADSNSLFPGQILNLSVPPRRPGTLILDFAPWASIESIVRSEDGAETLRGPALTPMTLQLPAGDYVVKAGNSELGSDLELNVTIEAGAVVREERPMPGFELQSELSSLLEADGR